MKRSKFRDYIDPVSIISSLRKSINELTYYSKYKKILNELEEDGKLKAIGFNRDGNSLFVGVNLNPELLMYGDPAQQESVELKFVSDNMMKYTDFLQKEEILDVIEADYERIKNDDYYGYVVKVSYKFKNYNKNKLIYDIAYLSTISLGIMVSLGLLIF